MEESPLTAHAIYLENKTLKPIIKKNLFCDSDPLCENGISVKTGFPHNFHHANNNGDMFGINTFLHIKRHLIECCHSLKRFQRYLNTCML